MIEYFNPRPREGSDIYLTLFILSIPISIHAPVKGATAQMEAKITAMYISIHAPVKGATGRATTFLDMEHYFNPRPREGSDRYLNIFYLNML